MHTAARRGPPDVALDGLDWAAPGPFGRRDGFASIWSMFFNSALEIVGGAPKLTGLLS